MNGAKSGIINMMPLVDALRKLVRKRNTKTTYLWDGDQVAYQETEKHGKTESQRHNVFNGWELIAQQDSYFKTDLRNHHKTWTQATNYAVCQPNGQSLALFNPQGKRTWRKAPSSLWGLPLLESWESKQAEPLNPNLLFAGQYFDQESGLAYNRFRYYDPQTGCYLKSDPIGLAGGETPYAYVHNPMGWIDPFGLAKCKLSTADKTKLGPAPSDMKKPHYHHVVREKAPKNWKPENKKYVTDAQDILKKYGIDKDKDLRNFVWAENGSGVHTVEKAKEVYQKLALSESRGLGEAGINAALKELGDMFGAMR